MPKRTSPTTLTPKQIKFIASLEAGSTLTQAARDAGYSETNPGQSGWSALRCIRKGLAEAADKLGFTPQAYFEKVLYPGMFATKVERAFFMGSKTFETEDPDYANRAKFAALTAKVFGAARDEVRIKGEITHMHVVDLSGLSDDVIERIFAMAQERPTGVVEVAGRVLPPASDSVAYG